MSAATDKERTLSAECALAQQPGYARLHDDCRQLADVELPHSGGMVLIARCGCSCHRTRAA